MRWTTKDLIRQFERAIQGAIDRVRESPDYRHTGFRERDDCEALSAALEGIEEGVDMRLSELGADDA